MMLGQQQPQQAQQSQLPQIQPIQAQQPPTQSVKPVQKRTKSACVHCQSAKVACSSMRPCVWCIRHGLQDTCVDAPKKERKRKSPEQPTDETTIDINSINMPNIHAHTFNASPLNTSPLTSPLNASLSPPLMNSSPLCDNSMLTTNVINFNTLPQYSFTPEFEIPAQFAQSTLSIFDDVDEFSIESVLSSAAMITPPSPSALSATVPNMDMSPQPLPTPIFNPTLPQFPPELMADPAVSDYTNIIMSEIKRAQASMENVALLSQVQASPHLLPSAVIKVPELLLTECNEAFAKLMEYNSSQDLVNAQITMLDLVFPQLRALLQRRAHKFMQKREPKLVRTALLQTRMGTAKCCTMVLKPNGVFCRLLILRSATGVPERAARKLECISALNMAKQKRCITELN